VTMRGLLGVAALCALTSSCAPKSKPADAARAGAGTRFGPVPLPTTSPLFGSGDSGTSVLAVEAGVTGDRVESLLEVPSDHCALVIARGSATIDDVDLMAFAEDGTSLGVDESPDKTPALLICPPHPRRIWLSARIASGHGLLALGAGRVLPKDAERARAAYRVKAGPDELGAPSSAFPALDEKLAGHRGEIGGTWQDLRRTPVPLESRLPTRISAAVEAGRCLDVLVVPGNDVGHIELVATDASGAILGRGQSSGRDRYLVVCAISETTVALEIRPHSGRGAGLLVLSKTRDGSERDLVDPIRLDAFPAEELDRAVKTANERLERTGYRDGRTALKGTLEVGRRTSFELKLPAGCSRLDFVGGAPLRGVSSWVFDAQDRLVASLASSGRGALFVCGPAGPVRFDAEATLRPGPFAVVVRPEPGSSAELVKAPLAAGRLLAQSIERGALQRAGDVGLVRRFELSEAAIDAFELTVPFGRCIDIALGLDPGAAGAEIRLVSAASGKEIALGRGPHATSTRVCALDAESVKENLKTRVELRVASGAGVGLVATRMSSPSR
jgi:hypothetical protein